MRVTAARRFRCDDGGPGMRDQLLGLDYLPENTWTLRDGPHTYSCTSHHIPLVLVIRIERLPSKYIPRQTPAALVRLWRPLLLVHDRVNSITAPCTSSLIESTISTPPLSFPTDRQLSSFLPSRLSLPALSAFGHEGRPGVFGAVPPSRVGQRRRCCCGGLLRGCPVIGRSLWWWWCGECLRRCWPPEYHQHRGAATKAPVSRLVWKGTAGTLWAQPCWQLNEVNTWCDWTLVLVRALVYR